MGGHWRYSSQLSWRAQVRFHPANQSLANQMSSTWKYPDIPGVSSFEGKLMHSGQWDDNFDLTGKRVAVIGGGSSAVQIVPAIQPKVAKLYPFLRSPVWITAGFGAKYAAPGGVNFNCKFQVNLPNVLLIVLQIPATSKLNLKTNQNILMSTHVQ